MGTTLPPSVSELAAKSAFEEFTGFRLDYNETGESAAADFRFRFGNSCIGHLEVSRITDPAWHKSRSFLNVEVSEENAGGFASSRLVAQLEGSGRCWLLVVRPDSDLRTLRSEIPPLLLDLENAGNTWIVAPVPGFSGIDSPTALESMLIELGVLTASTWEDPRAGTEHRPCVRAIVGLPGGSVNAAELLNLHVRNACADNAHKLETSLNAHLWLWVDEGTHLGAVVSLAMFEKYLTKSYPDLPKWITRVWIAYDRTSAERELLGDRIWAARPGEAWRLARDP